MRIGLTGASGLIGRATTQALTERGDTVVTFVRPAGGAATGETIRWDPAANDLDDDDLRRVGGLDAIVHLAGAGIGDRRWSDERKDLILQSRLASTALVVRAIESLASGVGVLASGSAIGIYGSRGSELLDETSTHGSDFLASVCRAWEDAAQPAADSGTVVTTLRTGIVMSARGGALKRQLPLFKLGLGGVLGDGRQWISPISLVDEVRAILSIIDQPEAGPVNLSAPDPVTNRAFTRALAHALGRPAMLRVPAVALALALGPELAHEAVLASQRVQPAKLINRGFRFAHPTTPELLVAALH